MLELKNNDIAFRVETALTKDLPLPFVNETKSLTQGMLDRALSQMYPIILQKAQDCGVDENFTKIFAISMMIAYTRRCFPNAIINPSISPDSDDLLWIYDSDDMQHPPEEHKFFELSLSHDKALRTGLDIGKLPMLVIKKFSFERS